MSVREYIGARYIPLFADPIEWDSTTAYEPLTVVKNQGNSYISRQYVPEGIALTNENYWILWADFNAQLEQYRREVQQFDGRITANANAIAAETTAREQSISAETEARENADTALEQAIGDETEARENADTALEASISAESAKRNKMQLLDTLSNAEWQPWSFVIIGHESYSSTNTHGTRTNQGSAVATINNVDYWITAIGVESTDQSKRLVIQNLATGNVVSDTLQPLGHANGMSYDGDHTIICANERNNTVVFIDVSNPASPSISTAAAPQPGTVSAFYIGTSGKIGIVTGDIAGYAFNLRRCFVYTDRTFATLERTIEFTGYDSNLFQGWQGITCDGDYIYIAHSYPECICALDYATGALARQITFKQSYSTVAIREIESFYKKGNSFYLSVYLAENGFNYPDRATNRVQVKRATLLKFDLDTPVASEFNYSNNVSGTLYDIVSSSSVDWESVLNNFRYPTRNNVYYFPNDMITLANHNPVFITLRDNITCPIELFIPEQVVYLTQQNNANVTVENGIWVSYGQLVIEPAASGTLTIKPLTRASGTSYCITSFRNETALLGTAARLVLDAPTGKKRWQGNASTYKCGITNYNNSASADLANGTITNKDFTV